MISTRTSMLGLCAGVAMACSSSHDPRMDDAGRDTCVAVTCAALGAECGEVEDGCGGRLRCGACAPGWTCGGVEPNRCAPQCTADAACPEGTFCDLGSGLCTTDCRTGSRVSFDIPAQRVALDVTLGGEPLPPEIDEGSVRLLFQLADPVTLSFDSELQLYAFGPTPDAPSTRRTDLSVTLSPGLNVVRLDNRGASEFPESPALPIATFEVAPGADRVHIDIPRARPTVFRVTLDGEALPSLPPTYAPYVLLRPPGADARRWNGVGVVHDPFETTTPPLEIERAVIPGVYDVVYNESAPVLGLPAGEHVVLAESVSIDGGMVAIDIPRAHIELDVSIDGVPVAEGTMMRLRPLWYSGSPIELPTTGGRLDAFVVPGRYEIGPVDAAGCVVEVEIDRTPSDPRALDFACTTTELHLAFAPAPDPSCLPSIQIGEEPWAMHTPIDPSTTSVVRVSGPAGRQRVRLRWSCDPFVDFIAGDGVVLGELAFAAGDTVEWTIPLHRVRFRAVVDGAPLEEPDERAASWWVRSPDRGFFGPYRNISDEMWTTERVIAVDYVPRWPARDASEWPITMGRVFEGSVLTDSVIDIELPRRRAEIDVTLGGRPLPRLDEEAVYPWGPGGWPAGLDLIPPGEYWGAQWLPSAELFPGTWWVLPGRYEVRYAKPTGWEVLAESSFPPPPIGLGCWIVE